MNMKTAYKVYLFCCVLFLTGLFLLVPVYAVEDMWTAASRIIKDIYTHIASVSTVLAGLMTGSFVVEKIFTIPGLGRDFVSAINQKDYTLIMGTTIVLATLIIVANVIVDILYKIIDPRIKLK